MNNFQFTKTAVGIGQLGGLPGMAIGAGVGLIADFAMQGVNNQKAQKAMELNGQQQFAQTHYNPYTAQGGYQQGGYRFGGPTDVPPGMAEDAAMMPTRMDPLFPQNPLTRPSLLQPRIPRFEFRSTQDRLRQDERSMQQVDLRRAQDAWKQQLSLQRGFATGGPVHIVPEAQVGRTASDAGDAGVVMGRVPGYGTGTDDQVAMGQINVSSNEGYMTEEELRRTGAAKGRTLSEQMLKTYPNTSALLRRTGHFVWGGPVDGGPRIQRSTVSSNDPSSIALGPVFDRMKGLTNYNQFLNRPILSPWIKDAQAAAEKAYPTPEPFQGQIPMRNMDLKQGDAALPTGDAGSDLFDAANKANDLSMGIGAGLGALTTTYNLFQKRTVPPPPRDLEPEKLDLRTGALRNSLASDRKNQQATALYAARGAQSIGRELGVLSAGLRQGAHDAMTVEGVENQERQYNNQSKNAAKQFNLEQRNQFGQREAQAQDQFRAMNGQAVSQSLNLVTGSVNNWMNNRIIIDNMQAQGDMMGNYQQWELGNTDKDLYGSTSYRFNRGRKTKRS